jgi:hypothetical protein
MSRLSFSKATLSSISIHFSHDSLARDLYPITFSITPIEQEEERVETDSEFEEKPRLNWSDFSDESDFLGPDGFGGLFIDPDLVISALPLPDLYLSKPSPLKRNMIKKESTPVGQKRKIKKELSSSPAPIKKKKIAVVKVEPSPFEEYSSLHLSDLKQRYPDKQDSEIMIMLKVQFNVYLAS